MSLPRGVRGFAQRGVGWGAGWMWGRVPACLMPSVTPDLFRGPPGRGGMLVALTVPLAAEWTPDQVRGDEEG